MLVFTMSSGGSGIFVYSDGDQSVVLIPTADTMSSGFYDKVKVFQKYFLSGILIIFWCFIVQFSN